MLFLKLKPQTNILNVYIYIFLHVLNQVEDILYFLERLYTNGRTFSLRPEGFNYVCNKSMHFMFTSTRNQNILT